MGRGALAMARWCATGGALERERIVVLIRLLHLLLVSSLLKLASHCLTMDKENQGKIVKLEEEAAHYREQLRRRCEEVELLKKEKARLEKSVRDKLAIAAAKKQ